jgi:hypothetical protein
MDDPVLFGPNKKLLHKARIKIEAFLNEHLGLFMKGNWQVFPISKRAVDFVGYKFYRTHTTIRRRNFLKFARQCRKAAILQKQGRQVSFLFASALMSRAGQLKHTDSHQIRVKYVDPINLKKVKEVIRNESKRRLIAQRSIYDRSAA